MIISPLDVGLQPVFELLIIDPEALINQRDLLT